MVNYCHPSFESRYPIAYNEVKIIILQTEVYARPFRRIRDNLVRVRIDMRVRRLSQGNTGDVGPVDKG